jgi:putative solute:sodium symporter small subunit|tara:strand:- start:868 stop:1119 length:252 start_codon:yes stop_codon:yes gene_type:complete
MKTNISYWNANLIIVIFLLSIWFLSSFGAGILFSDYLDNFQIGGFKLGFWFSQQGSIISFVFIIVLYCFLMNKLDNKYNSEED